MSLALYRRYRPETFAEVIGQEHVTDPLQQALRNNRVNHAYLFSGPRGCGKTTSARILARCLNCEQGPTPTPCGQCRSCTDLARGGPGSLDVIEIDAASHGGVDDARDLREKAFFAPVNSRYKIYIIDEAHMVTSAGFNALLKVVEEPPEHLKFIFATTEPEKVIGTIRSRTHHYPFRLVPPGVLREYLEQVCTQEGVTVSAPVLPLVVRAGAGSVRDSMSVMDQLLAGAGEDGVTYPMATALLGFTDHALLDEMVDAFGGSDGAAVFQVIDRVIEGGHDPRRFVGDLLERLRDLVVLAAVPDAADKGLIDVPGDQLERMGAQARLLGQVALTRAADIVNTGLTEMRGATSPRLHLELVCARVLLPAVDDGAQGLAARVDRLERRGALGVGSAGGGPRGDESGAAGSPPSAGPQQPSAGPQQPVASAPPARPAGQPAVSRPAMGGGSEAAAAAGGSPQHPGAPSSLARSPTDRTPGAWPRTRAAGAEVPGSVQATPAPAAEESGPGSAGGGDMSAVRGMWPQIVDAVKNRKRVTWMLLQQASVAGFDGRTLRISFEHSGSRDGFVNSGHDEILRQSIIDACGVDWQIECVVGAGEPSSRMGGSPAQRSTPPTPATRQPQAGARQAGAWPSSSRASDPVAAPRSAAQGQDGPGHHSSGAGGRASAPSWAQESEPPPEEPPPPYDEPRSARRPSFPAEPAQAPPPVAPEDDEVADDDVDVDDDGMTTHELLARELGATVIEETHNR